ncbi:MAG: cysteine desulfurase, partial [Gemmatimonadetes bacterium]|nr:cysteine desulfurase [Gemmatimonadota bacterium]
KLINARESREVIFVRGTTEAINLVAASYGKKNVGPGDEVLITHMEHHSNIVPWQMLCEEKGAKLVVAPIDDRGELMMDEFENLLTDRTRIVSVVHQSNSLGTINPVREIVKLAHGRGVPVLLDGAQTVAHKPVDVQELGCDFYALSGHKMFGPTGIGALYGRAEILEGMPPWQGGGDMIRRVTFEKTTFNDLPYKFEAGTPDIAAGIGLGASIDFLEGLDLAGAAEYEAELLRYAEESLSEFPEVRLIGTARKKSSVVSFVVDGMGALDVGTYLDQQGVAVRTGHHCTQPVMDRFGVSGTVRASLACYNNRDDIDRLVEGVRKVIRIFRG